MSLVRAVVLLYYMGEHSQIAIAEFLNVTTNAVKTRLYSARKRLRKYMGHIEENLNAARPSSDPKFAEKVQRLIRPEALKQKKPWMWSPGIGADVWEMFCACIAGDLEAVKRLLDNDPSLARSHYEYRTPLSFAARENHVEVAEFLLDHGADPLALGDVLQIARDRGYVEMERLLESKFVSLHGASSKGEAVASAIRERDPAKVRQLLDEAPGLLHAGDGRSNQPIHWAVMTRQIDIIDELLARGADINARRQDGARPIHLTNGDYHFRGWRDGDVQKAAALFAADPAQADDPEALKEAAGNGHEEFVRLILRYQPALARRVTVSRPREIVKLLFEHGMDPNHPNWLRITPLHHFAESGDLEGAAIFIEHGADLNARDEEFCSTPLAWAARRGQTRMVEFLLRHGAQLSLSDDLPDLGWATPLAWSRKKGHADIEADLEQAGAR